ncbi:hypothetical protein MKW98_024583 [Papaver atlanticum]|uniref:HECT-type E3 ubiquitin transferase n=1 Tax=Papaver atlanticum TaxID=357466 RepID=A0AAD4S7K4_9MAGN|nr:hypothetical protein MKW98_024583 [Papaver atlanticum]
MFSLHLRRAIEDHLGEKGLSLPVNTDALKEGDNTCYLVEIFLFHCDFSRLLTTLEQGLHCLEEAIRDAGALLRQINLHKGCLFCKRRLARSFFQATGLKGLDCAILGGDNAILLKDWKAHTMYEGYGETDEQVFWFWKVVEDMSLEQQRQLLFVLDFSEIPTSKWFIWFSISADNLQDILF